MEKEQILVGCQCSTGKSEAVEQCTGAGGQNVSKIKKFLSSSLSRVEFLLRVSERPLISLARAVVSNYFLSSQGPTNTNQWEIIKKLTIAILQD